MKKILAKAMCLVLAMGSLSGLVACGQNDDEAGNRTQLVIGNVDLGLGDEWLKAVKKDFEDKFANYQGEDGKVGVYVKIENKEEEYTTQQLVSNMPFNKVDLYMLAHADYMTLYSAKHNGKSILEDISDVVKGMYYDEQGNMLPEGTQGASSIESRMVDAYRTYYNLGTEMDSTYYGLPFYSTPVGITYDADLFNEESLYLRNGKIGANQADVDSGNCDAGADGVKGTYDDGLPATWNEFVYLMNAMKTMGIAPFIWSDADGYQREHAQRQIYANYEGYNDYMLLQTFNGTDSQFGEVNVQNGYELAGQEGRLAVAKAAYDIVHNGYYAEEAVSPSTNHVNAQMYYVWSVEQSTRIAMIFEGSWWENEAREEFDSMAKINAKYAYGKRNFKYMPMPNFDGTVLATAEETGAEAIVSTQKDERQVIPTTTSVGSMICVSAQAPQKELAIEFLKFMHSREMLVKMTQYSSTLRPFEYEFTDTELAGCTKYMQSILELISEDTTDLAWEVNIRGSVKENNSSYFKEWMYGGVNAFKTFVGTPNASAYNLFENENKKYSVSTWPVR